MCKISKKEAEKRTQQWVKRVENAGFYVCNMPNNQLAVCVLFVRDRKEALKVRDFLNNKEYRKYIKFSEGSVPFKADGTGFLSLYINPEKGTCEIRGVKNRVLLMKLLHRIINPIKAADKVA